MAISLANVILWKLESNFVDVIFIKDEPNYRHNWMSKKRGDFCPKVSLQVNLGTNRQCHASWNESWSKWNRSTTLQTENKKYCRDWKQIFKFTYQNDAKMVGEIRPEIHNFYPSNPGNKLEKKPWIPFQRRRRPEFCRSL